MRSYLFSFFLLFCWLSCSTIPDPNRNWVVKTADMTEAEARKVIAGKRKFLELTFEQVKDLSYNTPKWSAACLSQNRVGTITEEGSALLFTSELMTDGEFHTGLCSGQSNSRPAKFVYLYCLKTGKYFELRCFSSDCADYPWRKMC